MKRLFFELKLVMIIAPHVHQQRFGGCVQNEEDHNILSRDYLADDRRPVCNDKYRPWCGPPRCGFRSEVGTIPGWVTNSGVHRPGYRHGLES